MIVQFPHFILKTFLTNSRILFLWQTVWNLISASVRPKEENLVSAETEYSATLAETFGRIFGRNWCLEIRKQFLWIVINKFYHATQFPLNYIRCNLNFEMPDFFNLRTHFHKMFLKIVDFAPFSPVFIWPNIRQVGRNFRPNISANLAENFSRIFGFGRTLLMAYTNVSVNSSKMEWNESLWKIRPSFHKFTYP